MADIINITDRINEILERKEEEQLSLQGRVRGKAVCLHCRHEFRFNDFYPFTDMQCPECNLWTAVPKGIYGREEKSLVPVCEVCESDWTQVMKKAGKVRLICIHCGNELDPTIMLDDPPPVRSV